MNLPAYTPAPWRASIGALVRVVAGPSTVCGVHKSGRFTGRHDPRVTEANAYLIAAAPDYDSAARCYVQWIEHSADADIPHRLRNAMEIAFGTQLRAALAKARGTAEARSQALSKGHAP